MHTPLQTNIKQDTQLSQRIAQMPMQLILGLKLKNFEFHTLYRCEDVSTFA